MIEYRRSRPAGASKFKPILYRIDDRRCHICMSHKPNTYGYPCITVAQKPLRMSRFVFENEYGPIPTGLFVCHSCDNRRCINPEHLYLGTNGDNTRDREERNPSPIWDRHHNAVLTREQAAAVVRRAAAGESHNTLANQYGVHKSTVSKIVNGTNWRGFASELVGTGRRA